MALRGVRSSCETVARNSSLARLLASASLRASSAEVRAARSASKSMVRAASMRLRSEISTKATTQPRILPASSNRGAAVHKNDSGSRSGTASVSSRPAVVMPDSAALSGCCSSALDSKGKASKKLRRSTRPPAIERAAALARMTTASTSQTMIGSALCSRIALAKRSEATISSLRFCAVKSVTITDMPGPSSGLFFVADR